MGLSCCSTVTRVQTGVEEARHGETATLNYVDYATSQNDDLAVDIKLYWNIVSQPSRAIKSLLLAGDVLHEDFIIDNNAAAKDNSYSEEILQLNPQGDVPFTIINGQVYNESAAQLKLLSQLNPKLFQFYPQDIFLQHRINAMLEFNGIQLRPAIKKKFQLIMDFKF